MKWRDTLPKGWREWLQAVALTGCVIVALAVILAAGTTAGPARAAGHATAAPKPAIPETVPVPARPDRPPVTCAWLRKVGAGIAWQEIYGCWPPACLAIVRERIARRAS